MCEREPCKSLPTCATRGFKQHTHQPHHNGLTVTNIRVALTLRLIICHCRGGCCICWPRLGFPCPAIPVSTDSTTGTLGATAPGGNCYVHMEQAYIYTNMMRPLGSKKKSWQGSCPAAATGLIHAVHPNYTIFHPTAACFRFHTSGFVYPSTLTDTYGWHPTSNPTPYLPTNCRNHVLLHHGTSSSPRGLFPTSYSTPMGIFLQWMVIQIALVQATSQTIFKLYDKKDFTSD